MREFLFRGQTRRYGQYVNMAGEKQPGRWVYGGIFPGTGDFSIIYGADKEEFTGADLGKHPVYTETVGQYTGLKDKNGKRIFEGDIISFNDGLDYFKGEVVFENGAFGIGSDAVIGSPYSCCDNFVLLWQLLWEQDATDEPELYYCTVIGTIHDNPELLEVRHE